MEYVTRLCCRGYRISNLNPSGTGNTTVNRGGLLIQELLNVGPGDLGVAENLGEQPWANGLTGVYRHRRATAVRMPKEVMTAFDPADYETGSL
jgi:hypothetical protein